MTFTRRGFAVASLVSSFALAMPVSADEAPLSVVATTGMIADAAEIVGGDLVEVKSLMGPGVDPHAYRQTRSDIVALTQADLVLWNGLYLEAQMENFLMDLERRVPVVAVGEAVPVEDRLGNEDYADRFDPHIWMDPARWSLVVAAVADAMAETDPDNAETYATNATAYQDEITRLGDYAANAVSSVPEQARVLVTAHDAFNYFGEAFDFEVLGIQGISTESEAGLNRIGELVDFLVENDIGAVFVESSVSDRNIRALIEGAAAKGHEVVIGGELFSDAMGEPGSYEGTYIGMIDHNVTTIAGALGGDVPEAGMNGKLHVGM